LPISSFSSRRSRKRSRTRSSNFSVTPRVVGLTEKDGEEEEWLEHRRILVEMASSVEVSLEEVRRGREAGEEEGVEEDWQERRDRLGLGNRVVCYFSLDPSV
jgi:hypothetical protein